MSWVGPRFEITRLGRLVPAAGFMFENDGAPFGQASPGVVGTATARKVVGAVPAVPVRLNAAAAAVPSLGMCGVVSDPPIGTPESTTLTHAPALSGTLAAPGAHSVPMPPRESQIRKGGTLWNAPADDPAGVAKYPSTSTITSALPAALSRSICPAKVSVPSWTIARFDPTAPLLRLMLEAPGADPPAGYATTYVPPGPWSMAVMLTTTA